MSPSSGCRGNRRASPPQGTLCATPWDPPPPPFQASGRDTVTAPTPAPHGRGLSPRPHPPTPPQGGGCHCTCPPPSLGTTGWPPNPEAKPGWWHRTGRWGQRGGSHPGRTQNEGPHRAPTPHPPRRSPAAPRDGGALNPPDLFKPPNFAAVLNGGIKPPPSRGARLRRPGGDMEFGGSSIQRQRGLGNPPPPSRCPPPHRGAGGCPPPRRDVCVSPDPPQSLPQTAPAAPRNAEPPVRGSSVPR